MNEVAEYKLVNEKHLSIGEDVAKRAIAALQAGTINVTGYAVRDYGSCSEERLELNIGDKQTLVITFGRSKY